MAREPEAASVRQGDGERAALDIQEECERQSARGEGAPRCGGDWQRSRRSLAKRRPRYARQRELGSSGRPPASTPSTIAAGMTASSCNTGGARRQVRAPGFLWGPEDATFWPRGSARPLSRLMPESIELKNEPMPHPERVLKEVVRPSLVPRPAGGDHPAYCRWRRRGGAAAHGARANRSATRSRRCAVKGLALSSRRSSR